jgi:penicillin amidase
VRLVDAGDGIGHNGVAAWGITAGLADTVDLFIEQIGLDGTSVKRGEAFEACHRRTEVIEVKGRSPVVEEVLDTPRGPIIGPHLTICPRDLTAGCGSAHAPHAASCSCLARDFEAFRAGFDHWPLFTRTPSTPTQAANSLAAGGRDTAPPQGLGTLPLYASDPVPDGTGQHTLKSMPFVVDPHPATWPANNRPEIAGQVAATQTSTLFLGVDWLTNTELRITQALLAQ